MDQEDVVQPVPVSRRAFVKKLVAAGFAIPVISSFALDVAAGGSVTHDTTKPALAGPSIFTGNSTEGEGFHCHYPRMHTEDCGIEGSG